MLKLNSEVFCKYPPYRGKSDDPWFFGKIIAIKASDHSLKVRFADGDVSDDVKFSDILLILDTPLDSKTRARLLTTGKGSSRSNEFSKIKAWTNVSTAMIDKDLNIISKITYNLTDGHERWPTAKKAAITKAMDEACAKYNLYSNGGFQKAITVEYNKDVPTADGSINGHIRFGGMISFRVAIHEIAHTLGIGQHHNYRLLVRNGKWTGKKGLTKLREIKGSGAFLNADAMHFWPYGMNYDREYNSEVDVQHHVEMVQAMLQDCEESDFKDLTRSRRKGVYFTLNSDSHPRPVNWSRSTQNIRKDITFKNGEEYFSHREKHGYFRDWTHIENFDVQDLTSGDAMSDEKEDESEQFTCSYGDYDMIDLSCESSDKLNVVCATYGTDSRRIDVTEKLQDLIKGSSRLHVKDPIFKVVGDPLPYHPKRLKIVFSDGVIGTVGKYRVSFTDPSVVDFGHRGRELAVISATYGSNHGCVDVTTKIRQLVDSRKGRVYYDQGIWNYVGDPEPGVKKTLRVVFTCI